MFIGGTGICGGVEEVCELKMLMCMVGGGGGV